MSHHACILLYHVCKPFSTCENLISPSFTVYNALFYSMLTGLGDFMLEEVRVKNLSVICASSVTTSTKWYFTPAVVAVIKCFAWECLMSRLILGPFWGLKSIWGLMGILPKSAKSVMLTVCKQHLTKFSQNTNRTLKHHHDSNSLQLII